MSNKAIQIPEELFFQICRLCLQLEELEDNEADELAQAVQDGLKRKLEAMKRRATYSAYLDANASPEAREAARQQYLNLTGMLPGYRW